MASFKTGLDYYSHYIGMTKDKKLHRIRFKYGSVGVDVWLALLDMIYGDKGYYIEYGSDSEKEDVVWDVLAYVQGKYAPTAETVADIIEDLAACGLFSGDLFKSGILSSKRIQLQYYAGVVERKAVEVNPDYWLPTVEEMKKISGRSTILHHFDNRPICEDNQPICEDNQPNRKQSKVKESKVKESRVEESRVEESNAAPPPASPATRTTLVAEYGEKNVKHYEERFRKWAANKGKKFGENIYPIIADWMKNDGVAPPSNNNSLLEQAEKAGIRRYNG